MREHDAHQASRGKKDEESEKVCKTSIKKYAGVHGAKLLKSKDEDGLTQTKYYARDQERDL